MEIIKTNIKENITTIQCFSNLNNDVLIANISGFYEDGSKGSIEAKFLFSELARYYFYYDSYCCLILNFKNFSYSWGNSLIKIVNFFQNIGRDEEELNQKIFIVLSEESKEGIQSLVNLIGNTNISIVKTFEIALENAQKEVQIYYGEADVSGGSVSN